MFEYHHYQIIVCDAKGESPRGQYDSYNLPGALDEFARNIRRLTRAQLYGKPIGEGWVRLACLDDDTKSIMAGIL